MISRPVKVQTIWGVQTSVSYDLKKPPELKTTGIAVFHEKTTGIIPMVPVVSTGIIPHWCYSISLRSCERLCYCPSTEIPLMELQLRYGVFRSYYIKRYLIYIETKSRLALHVVRYPKQ